MNFKTTYFLIGIVVLVVGVFVIALVKGPPTEDTSNFVLPAMRDPANPLKPEDVERVEIQRTKPSEVTMVFEKDPATERWRITSPRDYPSDATAISDLVRQLYNATREK